MSRSLDGKKAFSLIELLVTMAVLTILAAVLLPALFRGKAAGRRTACLSNMKQIGIAMHSFHQEYERYPEGNLAGSLSKYMAGGLDVFVCPEDLANTNDSYSEYYCPRWEREVSTARYVLSCPRHRIGKAETGTVLFTLGEAGTRAMKQILWNGNPIKAGMEVQGGALTFADGSQCAIIGTQKVTVMTSFPHKGNLCYTVLKINEGEVGTLDNTVTHGAKYEIVTPSAVVGVEGTQFKVTTAIDSDKFQRTETRVLSSQVRVTAFAGSVHTVSAGQPVLNTMGPMTDAIASNVYEPPFTQEPVQVRGVWYYRKIDKANPDDYHLRWYTWDPATSRVGKDVGREEWEKKPATAPWRMNKDTFAPND